MRIAVFGQTGQVAIELARLGGLCLGREEADFADPGAVRRAAERVDADAIVNAVAYTAVDRAEDEEALARAVNAVSVGVLAEVAAARGLPFVQISTDYVFDGSGSAPWRADDPGGPRGAYRRTKLDGERAVAAAGGVHAVLRTSWVFSAHGTNFVKTMLRLGADRDRLRIVADQVGGPTPARGIAGACVRIADALTRNPGLSGTYHYAGAPDVSWADFARAIFAEAGMQVAVEDIPSTDYPTPAARPANSRLDCTATEAAFGIPRPDWREALRDTLAELRPASTPR
jgi:dTDP-4-dehydrorhamnose reductase